MNSLLNSFPDSIEEIQINSNGGLEQKPLLLNNILNRRFPFLHTIKLIYSRQHNNLINIYNTSLNEIYNKYDNVKQPLTIKLYNSDAINKELLLQPKNDKIKLIFK
jgi:hypothetical protein